MHLLKQDTPFFLDTNNKTLLSLPYCAQFESVKILRFTTQWKTFI